MNFFAGSIGLLASCSFWFALHRQVALTRRSLPDDAPHAKRVTAATSRHSFIQRGLRRLVISICALGAWLSNTRILRRVSGDTEDHSGSTSPRQMQLGYGAIVAALFALAGHFAVSFAVVVVGIGTIRMAARRSALRTSVWQERFAITLVGLAQVGVRGGLSARGALIEALGRAEALVEISNRGIAEQLRHRLALVRPLRECEPLLSSLMGGASQRLIELIERSDATGASLGDSFASLRHELEDVRCRRAEKTARQVPVKLLFPLVACVLPAFAVIALVPLLLSTLQSLNFS